MLKYVLFEFAARYSSNDGPTEIQIKKDGTRKMPAFIPNTIRRSRGGDFSKLVLRMATRVYTILIIHPLYD